MLSYAAFQNLTGVIVTLWKVSAPICQHGRVSSGLCNWETLLAFLYQYKGKNQSRVSPVISEPGQRLIPNARVILTHFSLSSFSWKVLETYFTALFHWLLELERPMVLFSLVLWFQRWGCRDTRRLSRLLPVIHPLGLPRWLSGEGSACQGRRWKRCRSDPWVGRSRGEKGEILQHSCLESHTDRGVQQGYSPWSRRVRHDSVTKHTDTHTQPLANSVDKSAMATGRSVLTHTQLRWDITGKGQGGNQRWVWFDAVTQSFNNYL